MNNLEYKEQVIVITGASRGIGKACALALANETNTLVLMARKEQELKSVADACKALGAKVHYVIVDLTNTTDIKEKIQKISQDLGHIDILINNAGIWIEKPFMQGDMSEWDNALDVNLKSSIHLTRYCLDSMPTGGAVIFIGSTASKKTYAGGTNYCAAKFGLLGFANSLFEDIRDKGIKVSTILPGVVNTDMHKDDPKLNPEKMIQPEDVAQTVKFILAMPINVCPTEITLMPQYNPKTY